MDLKTLSETLKNANITEEAGEKILDQNPMNLPQAGEGIGGTSQDQTVKNRKGGKYVKKRKRIQHSLRAIGVEIEQINDETNFMVQKLRREQVEIEQQKVEQNKIITAQENSVVALLQEPFVQQLMAGSNQLEIAQCVMVSPNANLDARMPSEGGIVELKHRSKVLDMLIEVVCKKMTE